MVANFRVCQRLREPDKVLNNGTIKDLRCIWLMCRPRDMLARLHFQQGIKATTNEKTKKIKYQKKFKTTTK